MRTILGIGSTALAIALGASGCFSIVSLDQYHVAKSDGADGGADDAGAIAKSDAPAPTSGYLNLQFVLVGMTPHVAQLFEYRVIDANSFIQFRGMANPLGAPDVTFNVPSSVPVMNGPFHLDFYADVNHSGGYDGIGSVISNDHAWRIDPLENYPPGTTTPGGLIQVTFTHNTSFTDIDQYPSGTPKKATDTGLGATIRVVNAGNLQGHLIQARIVDAAANHTVGLFRVAAMTQDSFEMLIPGVVETGAVYNALVYVDANGNGTYDNPATGAGDLGWTVPGTADTKGLTVTVDTSALAKANVDVGAP
jgi:hypothetical protein